MHFLVALCCKLCYIIKTITTTHEGNMQTFTQHEKDFVIDELKDENCKYSSKKRIHQLFMRGKRMQVE